MGELYLWLTRTALLRAGVRLLLVLASFSSLLAAQTGIPTNTSAPPLSGAGAVTAKTFLSDFEFELSAEILVFGLGVVLIEFLLLRKAGVSAEPAL